MARRIEISSNHPLEFTDRDLFLELSTNFLLYRNVLELVRIYLDTAKSRDYLRAKRFITDSE